MGTAGSRRAGRAPAIALGVALLAAGCSSGGSDTPEGSGSGSGATFSGGPSAGSGGPSASASPTSTLTPAQQQAFEEATAVVLAYRQTITDLYSGARTNLNDLDAVATGELLDRDLKNISKSLLRGWKTNPRGGSPDLVEAAAVSVRPGKVIVKACIDTTDLSDVAPDGTSTKGIRERLSYSVVKTSYLPEPGWAVSRVTSSGNRADRRC